MCIYIYMHDYAYIYIYMCVCVSITPIKSRFFWCYISIVPDLSPFNPWPGAKGHPQAKDVIPALGLGGMDKWWINSNNSNVNGLDDGKIYRKAPYLQESPMFVF